MSAFAYREPGKIVQDVIQSELGLTDGQVMFTDQPYEIPTKGLLVVVSYIGPSKVIVPQNEWIDDGAQGLTEVQSVTMEHLIQIDLLSFGTEARTRKEEIAMAMRSFYAESLQEMNSMQIARQPGPFLDTSFLEDSRRVTRFTTTVRTVSVNQKSKAINDIYTDFSRAVPPQVTVNA